MDPVMGVAIFIIAWWIAFFLLLPVGVRNLDEAGDEAVRGVERGAPHKPMLWIKAVWAAGLAFVIWLLVFVAIRLNLFDIRP